MTTPTKRDAIDAALSVADDVAHGRVDPAALQQQAVTELREMFGSVVGEGDPLWTLHADVARQAVSLGALSADELSEWAAVMRHRAGEAVEPPAPRDDPLPAVSAASVDQSQSESDGGDDDAPAAGDLSAALALLTARSIEQRAQEDADPPKPHGSAEGYDPLAGWDAGDSRRGA